MGVVILILAVWLIGGALLFLPFAFVVSPRWPLSDEALNRTALYIVLWPVTLPTLCVITVAVVLHAAYKGAIELYQEMKA
ncbi:hypothetical protein vBPaeQDWS_10 [Pseudomonas phage vB_Pae_QDWS]|nr:hypothetical protein vBPaeQDWS_10 [Pseudomonas phage vB_Pae_QDWS]